MGAQAVRTVIIKSISYVTEHTVHPFFSKLRTILTYFFPFVNSKSKIFFNTLKL